MAHDDEFLEHTLQNALQVDEFTASLYDIWVKVRNEGVAQVPIIVTFQEQNVSAVRYRYLVNTTYKQKYFDKKMSVQIISSFCRSVCTINRLFEAKLVGTSCLFPVNVKT